MYLKDNLVKSHLESETRVPPGRMKLLGLISGKLPDDSTILSKLGLKLNHLFTLIGTPDADMLLNPDPSTGSEILNDLDFDYSVNTTPVHQKEENIKKLNSYIEKTNIVLINEIRNNKKLIVFDLDYTLFDCKSSANHISELARPGMHDLLIAIYPFYEIVIWSQTSWKWLEMKITELGLLTHSDYKIAFVMDRTSMFSVQSHSAGKLIKHEVKALEIIYAKFPHFSAKNSVHVDDLSRNFAMNPKSGLKISAFKNGPQSRNFDRELIYLRRYLLELKDQEDWSDVEHKNWRRE